MNGYKSTKVCFHLTQRQIHKIHRSTKSTEFIFMDLNRSFVDLDSPFKAKERETKLTFIN